MQYLVTSHHYRRYEIADENHQLVGKIDYSFWRVNKAVARMANGDVYEFAPAGFWNLSMEITKNGVAFGVINYEILKRGLSIQFEAGQPLFFTKKSFWSGSFKIMTRDRQDIAFIYPEFKWTNFNYQYLIDANDAALNAATSMALPFIMLYCTRFLRFRRAAVA